MGKDVLFLARWQGGQRIGQRIGKGQRWQGGAIVAGCVLLSPSFAPYQLSDKIKMPLFPNAKGEKGNKPSMCALKLKFTPVQPISAWCALLLSRSATPR